MAPVTGLRERKKEKTRDALVRVRDAPVRRAGLRPRHRRGDRGIVRRLASNVLPVLRVEGRRPVRRQRRSLRAPARALAEQDADASPFQALEAAVRVARVRLRRAARVLRARHQIVTADPVAAHAGSRTAAGLGEQHHPAAPLVGTGSGLERLRPSAPRRGHDHRVARCDRGMDRDGGVGRPGRAVGLRVPTTASWAHNPSSESSSPA